MIIAAILKTMNPRKSRRTQEKVEEHKKKYNIIFRIYTMAEPRPPSPEPAGTFYMLKKKYRQKILSLVKNQHLMLPWQNIIIQ